ncbi:MAG: murein biosynthesis integral membrane protein MurJ [Candidatus Omnitrophica bacterium]|nr:murein biosynthesis integral membrane protein MurJ [Candidatus Omnitrophota bacterium]
MKEWLGLFSQQRISGAVVILILLGVIRLVVGVVSQGVIAYRFGATSVTDAYFVSSVIPQVIGDYLVGGAIFIALMPVFIDCRRKDGETEAWQIVSTFVTVAVLLLSACCLAYFLFAGFFIRLVAPGFGPEAQRLAVITARILSPLFLFFGLSLVASSLLQADRRFAVSQAATLAFPCGIVLGCIFFYPFLKSYSLPAGALVGAFLQFALQWGALKKGGLHFSLGLDFKHPAVKRLFIMTLHVALAVMLAGSLSILQRFLASRGPEGLVAAFCYAQYLGSLPLLFFISPIFVVIFPSLSSLSALGDKGEFSNLSSLAIRITNFLALPSTILVVIFRVDIIKIVLMRGQFGTDALRMTQEALFFLAFGLWAFANTGILTRAFFAIKDTKTNLLVTALSVACAVPLSVLLFAKMGLGGLALAASVGNFVGLGGFIYCYNKKIGRLDFGGISVSFLKTLLASFAMALAACFVSRCLYGFSFASEFASRCISLSASSIAGILVFFTVALTFRMEEARRILTFVPFLKAVLDKSRP